MWGSTFFSAHSLIGVGHRVWVICRKNSLDTFPVRGGKIWWQQAYHFFSFLQIPSHSVGVIHFTLCPLAINKSACRGKISQAHLLKLWCFRSGFIFLGQRCHPHINTLGLYSLGATEATHVHWVIICWYEYDLMWTFRHFNTTGTSATFLSADFSLF